MRAINYKLVNFDILNMDDTISSKLLQYILLNGIAFEEMIAAYYHSLIDNSQDISNYDRKISLI